jgi:hypothetical protein
VVTGKSLLAYDTRSAVADAYRELAAEILAYDRAA